MKARRAKIEIGEEALHTLFDDVRIMLAKYNELIHEAVSICKSAK